MITGIVKAREPLIRLTVRGIQGREQEIEAVVDTGNTGWLSLPPKVIADLGLGWCSYGSGTLADGSTSFFDVYEAKILWNGRRRRVYVDELDAKPLIGMALLSGCELKVQVRSRGEVTITRLPS